MHNGRQMTDQIAAALVGSHNQATRSLVAHSEPVKAAPPRITRSNFIVASRNHKVPLDHGPKTQQV